MAHEKALRDAHLGSRKPNAFMFIHHIEHAEGEILEPRPKVFHRGRDPLQGIIRI